MRIVIRQLTGRQNSKAPRHPEVNQENPTALEPKNQILAATVDSCDTLALDLTRYEIRSERAREPRVGDGRLPDSGTREGRRDLPAYGLDFRKLGHRSSVSTRWGAQRCRVVQRSCLGDDVEQDVVRARLFVAYLVGGEHGGGRDAGRAVVASVDLGEDRPVCDAVAALRVADDADGVVDRVGLGPAACAELERSDADREGA